jgi:hypothetical protein
MTPHGLYRQYNTSLNSYLTVDEFRIGVVICDGQDR